jgi:hypothetical protein
MYVEGRMKGILRATLTSLSLCLALLASCGGRNASPDVDAGLAGGTGGSAGSGGAGASGGSGGGTGGSGGSSGDTDAGTGASGGTGGGSAGSGGAGASGGSSGGTAGAGATGGAAGAGATGGAAGATGGAAGSDPDGGGFDGAPLDVSSPPDVGFDGRYPDGCVALTCTPVGGQFCGRIGDGCGGAVECGACPGHQVCGARTPKVCSAPCPLCPQIPKCEAGATTVSGVAVTASTSTTPDPLYGAYVYIPNLALGAKMPPFTDGPSCNLCPAFSRDEFISVAVTGPDGRFQLTNVPAGSDIPLVVQLGHWRYETTIDVLPCVDNALPDGTARLPRTQAEGHIPLTAISTGNVDGLECIFRKMGVADSEFSNPAGNGRIHFYQNNGARYDANTPLQLELVGGTADGGAGTWNRYDQVLFPCEGRESAESATALANLVDYTSKGGRVIATHFSYTWLYQNAGFATAGSWQVNQLNPVNPLIANIDVTTRKGQDFATWLANVGALSNAAPPQVSINDPRHNLNAVPMGQGGRRWIYSEMPSVVQHMSIETPVNATPDQGCGRVIFSDFHVANSASNSSLTFPAECPSNELTPQEKMLEFMLLDLSACVSLTPGKGPPPPPPPPPDPPF